MGSQNLVESHSWNENYSDYVHKWGKHLRQHNIDMQHSLFTIASEFWTLGIAELQFGDFLLNRCSLLIMNETLPISQKENI